MADDVGQKILKLKEDSAKAQQLRAQAEGNLAVVKDQLAKTDAKLKEMGLDPDQCEQQLAEMEAELERKVSELSAALATEIAAYKAIIEQTKAALA